MFYSDSFSVDCPDGYCSVVRPKSWSDPEQGYGKLSPKFKVRVDKSILSKEAILRHIIEQLSNLYEVRAVLNAQLARCSENDFIVALPDEYCSNLTSLYQGSGHDVRNEIRYIEICSTYIYLFQKKINKLAS